LQGTRLKSAALQITTYLSNPLFILGLTSLLALLVYVLWIVRPLPLLETYPQGRLDGRYIYRDKPYNQVRLIGSFLVLGLLYLWGWWAARRANGRLAWGILLTGALACAGALLFLYPFDAADIFDNIMHGRILGVYGENPLANVGVEFWDDPFYRYMAWKANPSAYGPLWETMAGAAARLAGDGIVANILAFKLLPGVFWLGSLAIAASTLRRRAPGSVLPGVYLLAWNPMVLYSTFGNGHNDIVMVFWVLLAFWALQARRYTTAILALLGGALVKYIPLLLIPAAVWIALSELQGMRPRLQFLALTGAVGLALVWLAYRPFWVGLETLTIERRASLLSSSLPAVAYHLRPADWDAESTARWIGWAALALTTLFVLWRSWAAGRERSRFSFPQASFDILTFYLVLTCLWFQQWYTVWLVGIAAVLPFGFRQRFAAFFSLAAFSKQLVAAPLLFKPRPAYTQPGLEIRFTLAVLGLPWLYLAAGYLNQKRVSLLRNEPGDHGRTINLHLR
jgi:hypothetical protein